MRTGLLRFGLLVVTVFSLTSVTVTRTAFGAPGLYFFGTLIYVNFAFITVAGLSYFPAAITEEKEEMTLGLLRMAGINHIALLLGKTLPRLFAAVLLLTVQFPFTLLAITLGGVSAQQLLAMYMALLTYTVLLACLALLFSTVCRRTTTAAGLTGLMIGLFLAGVPFTKYSLEEAGRAGWIDLAAPFLAGVKWMIDLAHDASPIQAVYAIWATDFGESPVSFQVLSNVSVGLLLFGLSWLVFDHFTDDLPPPGPGRRAFMSRCGRRVNRVWRYALVWKDFFFVAGGWSRTIAQLILYPLIIAGIVWCITYFDPETRITAELISGATLSSMCALLVVMPLFMAGRVFRNEVQWKTHSSLMLLPVSTRRLACEKNRRLRTWSTAGRVLRAAGILFELRSQHARSWIDSCECRLVGLSGSLTAVLRAAAASDCVHVPVPEVRCASDFAGAVVVFQFRVFDDLDDVALRRRIRAGPAHFWFRSV